MLDSLNGMTKNTNSKNHKNTGINNNTNDWAEKGEEKKEQERSGHAYQQCATFHPAS